ncbi:MAG: hypothetical protein HJJLKODD_01851 [Phycisphaerae bacterium]|nr:hypothetical protein [Phycisphaerae bacterium]
MTSASIFSGKLRLMEMNILLVGLLGCSPGANPSSNDNNSPTAPTLATINDYAYQLQGDPQFDLEVMGASAFDLLIIDYSATGDDADRWTAQQIAALKNSSGGPKIVLAYMSIGEAETYRFYFDPAWITPDPGEQPDGPFELTAEAPDFLAPPNPDFPNNLKVRYWLPEWQEIILDEYLPRLLEEGFDGVYLDIIDAYEYFGPEEIGGNDENRAAADEMIDFVIAIAESAAAQGRPDFLIVPQNGEAIIDAGSYVDDALQLAGDPESEATAQRNRYFAVINGLGVEDTFYFGDENENNPLNPDEDRLELINQFHAAGKTILAIDYLTESSLIDDFYARARQRGWIPYCSIRALDQLTINPTQHPD